MKAANLVIERLNKLADPSRIAVHQRFFKTAAGEYAEGDQFIGVKVPDQRLVAKEFAKLVHLDDIAFLLVQDIHEYRLTSLFLLDYYYRQSQRDPAKQKAVVDLYLNHLDYINNWDLVDSSAHKILGKHYENRDRSVLYQLATSGHLWSERIAIIATMDYIKKGDFKDTLALAEVLLHHPHDLIHKAVGWMLREIGKKEIVAEIRFLDKNYKKMPRTMLRYAIEKFPEDQRKAYLRGEK